MSLSSQKKNNTLYLVDVSSLFFRSFYAVSAHLTSPKGLPTNALYGFLSTTVKFLREYSVEYLVYCFDHEKPSFRREIYPLYKANRSEMPSDLKKQVPYVKQLTRVLGIPLALGEGYEADDLIGSLCTLSRADKRPVVIVSGDKDFAQLAGEGVSLYDPMRDKKYNTSGVLKKWGVLPEQMVDYLALTGDASDNIPGAAGIGPKGAVKLLTQYNNLDNIYRNVQTLPGRLAQKLTDSKKNVFLSQKLARIVTDIYFKNEKGELKPVLKPKGAADLSTNVFRRGAASQTSLENLLKELGFALKPEYFALCSIQRASKNLLKNNLKPSAEVIAPASAAAQTTGRFAGAPAGRVPSNLKTHFVSLEELYSLISPYAGVWVFPYKKEFFLVHKHKVISLAGLPLPKIGRLLLSKNVLWFGHDLKSLWRKLLPFYGVLNEGPGERLTNLRPGALRAGGCSMMACYAAEALPPPAFAHLCSRYLEQELSDDLLPAEVYRLHVKLQKVLENKLAQQNMTAVYKDIELPLIAVLFEMEQRGVRLNQEELKQQLLELNKHLAQLEGQIFDYAKHEFNVSSPRQLADVLFKEMGLTPLRKTKTGYSTDADVLYKLRKEHLIIPLILEHRELFKLKTTYVEALPVLVNKDTGRVHTHFRQALTSTGRLSSVQPNLQNIPVRTQRGRRVRRAFTAGPGGVLISADYSQMELRVLAHLTQDPALCSAFEQDLDIHRATASEVYGVPLKEVSAAQRSAAKAVNFGLIYGQGPYTLSESLEISLTEAKDLIQRYFKKFKRVGEYIQSAPEEARARGYAETLFGRRRVVEELSSSRFWTKKFGERAAVNSPVQGTAGDIVKIAMVRLQESVYSSMLLQIHDEILFECPQELLEEETSYIKNIMENVVLWKVPLKVRIASGPNWSCF